MNKEFDFDNKKKPMPYKVPESFFSNNRREILKQTCGEAHKKKSRLKQFIPIALVAAAALSGWFFLPLTPLGSDAVEETAPVSAPMLAVGVTESSATETMDAFIENLSDEELQELAEQSENDIFLF